MKDSWLEGNVLSLNIFKFVLSFVNGAEFVKISNEYVLPSLMTIMLSSWLPKSDKILLDFQLSKILFF